jgi:hypothetical protein
MALKIRELKRVGEQNERKSKDKNKSSAFKLLKKEDHASKKQNQLLATANHHWSTLLNYRVAQHFSYMEDTAFVF